MSISGSLSTALSGLTAVSRSAEAVSSNIANAMTEGYGKRDVILSSRVLAGSGSGVRVDGVTRNSDPVVIGNRRLSEAMLGQASALTGFLGDIESAIGTPDSPSSLTARLTDFESALIQAASRPDSEARQFAVVQAAKTLTTQLNTVSDRIQSERMEADRAIGTAVDLINTSLGQIRDLNVQIVRYSGGSQDPSALIDQRQRLIDGISELIPIREVPRDNGTVALFTPGGAILLDGKPAELEFTPVGVITPDMTLGSGALSGLTINGSAISTSVDSGPIAGGRLAGLFDVRDVQAPYMQTRVDAVARDLIERFEDPSVDATLNPGDPGLFTDAGAAFSAADELGLAARISVNALVDPAEGGLTWRLRDGLNATVRGDAGDASLLNALADTLTVNRLPATGGFSVPHTAIGLFGDLLSGVSVELQGAESQEAHARAQNDTFLALELRGGVDTDEEMQKLLLIEQAFAANARVISTIDQMIQTLIGL